MSIIKHAEFPENQAYHDGPGVSWSKFDIFLNQSPLQYDWQINKGNRSISADMIFGSLVHAIRFEPDLIGKNFSIREDRPLKTNDQKRAFIDYLVSIRAITQDQANHIEKPIADELRKMELNSPVKFFSKDDWDRAHRVAALVEPYFIESKNHYYEAAFYAEIEGLKVKCKVDDIDIETLQIRDIKCRSQITKWLSGLSYGDQLCGDAWYRMVIREATGELPPPIEYVGVSTVEPYEVCVRSHQERDFYIAEMRIRDGLKRFKQCQESGEWPGVDPTPEARKVEVRPYTKKLWEIEVYGIELTMESAMEQINALEYWTE